MERWQNKNKQSFLEHLETIRYNKYDLSDQEHQKEIFCIAAPVFDYNNQVSMAISMSGLYSDETEKELADVRRLARKISHKLGYQEH